MTDGSCGIDYTAVVPIPTAAPLLAHSVLGPPYKDVIFVVLMLVGTGLIKLAAYHRFVRWLAPRYAVVRASVPVVAIVRTLVGLAIGSVYWLFLMRSDPAVAAYLGLAFLRFWEWMVMVAIFFDGPREGRRVSRLLDEACRGTLLSTVLDVGVVVWAVPAFVITYLG